MNKESKEKSEQNTRQSGTLVMQIFKLYLLSLINYNFNENKCIYLFSKHFNNMVFA